MIFPAGYTTRPTTPRRNAASLHYHTASLPKMKTPSIYVATHDSILHNSLIISATSRKKPSHRTKKANLLLFGTRMVIPCASTRSGRRRSLRPDPERSGSQLRQPRPDCRVSGSQLRLSGYWHMFRNSDDTFKPDFFAISVTLLRLSCDTCKKLPGKLPDPKRPRQGKIVRRAKERT